MSHSHNQVYHHELNVDAAWLDALAAFLVMPVNDVLSGICIPSVIIALLSPMPDYMEVHLVCRQVP